MEIEISFLSLVQQCVSLAHTFFLISKLYIRKQKAIDVFQNKTTLPRVMQYANSLNQVPIIGTMSTPMKCEHIYVPKDELANRREAAIPPALLMNPPKRSQDHLHL